MFLLQIHGSDLTRFNGRNNCPSTALSRWRSTGKAAFVTLKDDVYHCSVVGLVRRTGVCVRRGCYD